MHIRKLINVDQTLWNKYKEVLLKHGFDKPAAYLQKNMTDTINNLDRANSKAAKQMRKEILVQLYSEVSAQYFQNPNKDNETIIRVMENLCKKHNIDCERLIHPWNNGKGFKPTETNISGSLNK